MYDDENEDRRLRTATPVVFKNLTRETAQDLQRLNQVIFPVRYSDKFYEDCAKSGSTTQLAYERTGSGSVGACVGGIGCRLEMDPTRGGARLYIATLGVYAPHRDGKIGSRMLQHALNEASRDSFIKDAYLHVQVNNYAAVEFYERFGFAKGDVLKNYYKRIEPPDAVVLERDLSDWAIVNLENVTFDRETSRIDGERGGEDDCEVVAIS